MGTTNSETDGTVPRLEEPSRQKVEYTFKSESKERRNLYNKYLLQMAFSDVILNRINSQYFNISLLQTFIAFASVHAAEQRL